MPATVWVKPLATGTWEPIGVSSDRGIWHEGLEAISNQGGPLTASFTLKRKQRGMFPDLLTDTPVIVEEGGVRVWRGRVKDGPEQSGPSTQIAVQCVGGQAFLDDDALERILVHNDLTAYRDMRSFLGTDLTTYTQAYQLGSQDGATTLALPAASTATSSTACGVTFDAGPANLLKRVVVTVKGGGRTNFGLMIRGGSTEASAGDEFSVLTNTVPTSSTTYALTFSTPRRYARIVAFNASGVTMTGDETTWVQVSSIIAFADTAYESGNASILSAKTIITDALTSTNLATALHPDWTAIGDPTFAFPNFAPDAPKTPRELITAANAPHGWRFKIDENLKPVYQAHAAVPVIDLGAWLGAESNSGSGTSDEGIATKVIVRGTGPDGAPVRSTGSQTGTVIDRQGGVRTQTLDTNYKLNSTLADKLRDAYLTSHRVSPFKGQNVVTYAGARRTDSGLPVRPAHLLLLTSELARRTDLVDPDTGALGRTAVIDQVTYRDDDQIAEIDLDNTRHDFEALQERLGLLVPA